MKFFFIKLSSPGAFPGFRQYLAVKSPLQKIKKPFLYYFKSSFRSEDIYIFALVNSFITSQTGNNHKIYCPVSQEVKQSGNEIRSVNRV